MARKIIAKNTETNEEVHADVESVILDGNSEAAQAQVESKTHLEDDEGSGEVAIIRQFKFKMDVDAFAKAPVSKQGLFNHHLKQIEIILWKDGMKVMPEVPPQLQIDAKKRQYTIIIGASIVKGNLLLGGQKPKKLSEIAHA